MRIAIAAGALALALAATAGGAAAQQAGEPWRPLRDVFTTTVSPEFASIYYFVDGAYPPGRQVSLSCIGPDVTLAVDMVSDEEAAILVGRTDIARLMIDDAEIPFSAHRALSGAWLWQFDFHHRPAADETDWLAALPAAGRLELWLPWTKVDLAAAIGQAGLQRFADACRAERFGRDPSATAIAAAAAPGTELAAYYRPTALLHDADWRPTEVYPGVATWSRADSAAGPVLQADIPFTGIDRHATLTITPEGAGFALTLSVAGDFSDRSWEKYTTIGTAADGPAIARYMTAIGELRPSTGGAVATLSLADLDTLFAADFIVASENSAIDPTIAFAPGASGRTLFQSLRPLWLATPPPPAPTPPPAPAPSSFQSSAPLPDPGVRLVPTLTFGP